MRRRTLLTLAALTGGAVIVDLASTIDSAPEGARLRTGRIVRLLGAQQVVVDIGGGELVDMPCFTADPILGDVVQILQQGAVLFVLGRTNPTSGDHVLNNPSFELDTAGSAPSSWTKVIATGTFGDSSFTSDVATGWGSVTGVRWLELNSANASIAVIHAVSEAIPVQAGELWTAAGYAVNLSSDTDGGTSRIDLTWYGDNTSMYPATAAADVTVGFANFPIGGLPYWTLLRQIYGSGVEVPAGVTYMRVVATAFIRGGVGSSAYWDCIVCRKLQGV